MPEHRRAYLRATLVALVLLVAVVAGLGTWQVIDARNSQRTQIQNGEAVAANLASSAVASALADRLQLVNNLAHQPGAASYFGTDRAQLPSLLRTLHSLYPVFASFDIIQANGRLLSRWPSDPMAIGEDLSQRDFFVHVHETLRPYVSEALQQTAPPNALVIGLAAPVLSASGTFVGIVQCTLPVSTLGSLIGGAALVGGGRLVIIDQNGHPISGPAASASRSYKTLPFVAAALDGHAGVGSGAVPGFAGRRLVGYSPVPSTGWAVLVEESASVLDSPVTALTARLLTIGLAVLVVAIGTALLVALLIRRLAREHEQAGAVLASVGEGVATVDASGRIVNVNRALEQLTLRRPRELIGRRWSDTLQLYDQRGEPIAWESSAIAQAIAERRVVASTGYSVHLGRRDGRRIPVAMTAAPLLLGDTSDGAVVVIRDVSREREVDQLKSSLVSTVSHELRTPLTMIQGFSELLLARDDLGPERSREGLELIHASSRRLGRLIDDLLSVSRIESGKAALDLGPVALPDVITEVLLPFEVADDHRFVADVDPNVAPVLADHDKTVQALTNLVSNAVKFSPEGSSVRVVVRSEGDHAEISVIDEGIGLSAEEAAGVFEKFVRSENPAARRVGGTGLGLYITKNLVELQHGQLWVRSELGKGSTFAFSLPLVSDEPPGAPAQAEVEEPAR